MKNSNFDICDQQGKNFSTRKINDDRLALNKHGFLEIDKKPSVQELQDYYAMRYYQTECSNYRQTYPEDELEFVRKKIEQKKYLIDQLGYCNKNASLLDVGCGEGFVLQWFHQQGYSVRGLDFSDVGVLAMNPDVAPLVETGDVFEALQNLIRSKQQFDIIWLQNVLEHVLEPVELLRSLRSLVPEKGVMLITVPNDGTELQESLFKQGAISRRFWIAPPDHLSYFNVDTLGQVIQATGWQCLDMIGDFPIDMFLLHPGSNYVNDSTKGSAAHRARIQMELMIAARGHQAATDYFRATAAIGIGRSLTAIVTPSTSF